MVSVSFDYNHTSRVSPQHVLSIRRIGGGQRVPCKEFSEGRVLGPFDASHFSYVHTSHFGVIPKGLSGKWLPMYPMCGDPGCSSGFA